MIDGFDGLDLLWNSLNQWMIILAHATSQIAVATPVGTQDSQGKSMPSSTANALFVLECTGARFRRCTADKHTFVGSRTGSHGAMRYRSAHRQNNVFAIMIQWSVIHSEWRFV